MDSKKIGWIGLGNMGVPMAKNLLRAGYPVTVYNRTAARAVPLQEAGAGLAVSPAALWDAADIVITMVSDDAALRQVHEGVAGLQVAGGFCPEAQAKDLRLALSQGLHSPGGITLHDSYQQALVNGWGEKDISAIFPFLDGKKA